MTANQLASSGHRENNFDFLRHIAAFLVIYGHSLALLGYPTPRLWGTPISAVGVLIFFSLSGYLVTESWERSPHIAPFLVKRALRIFPALIVCVSLCAIILGPALTRISIASYFSNVHFWNYFWNVVLRIRYSLPGVFEQNPIPNAVNGSLWSLPVEFFCYLTVIALALGPAKYRLSKIVAASIPVAIAGVFFSTMYKGPQIVFYATDVAAASSVIPYFFAGSLLRLLAGRLPLRLDISIIAAFGLYALESLAPGQVLVIACYFAIPYIVLSLGTGSTPVLKSWGRYGDFSYGMYLYSFPIQQTLIFLFPEKLGSGIFILISTIASVALASLSWHLVEKRCLRLKPGAKRGSNKTLATQSALAATAA